jgi:hypothetical protein
MVATGLKSKPQKFGKAIKYSFECRYSYDENIPDNGNENFNYDLIKSRDLILQHYAVRP